MSRFNGLRFGRMSVHSYSRCWIHLIWGTLDREKLLNKTTATRVSRYLNEYAESKSIYMKVNYVNADHVHALIDLPTSLSIEELAQLLKGSSSHWINASDLITGKFALGKGLWCVFLSLDLTWTRSRDASRIRKDIIAHARSQRNSENSSIATG
jgi:REP element-mobilizing transposase RayT